MKWRYTDLASVISLLESGSRPTGGASTESGTIPSLGGENILRSGGATMKPRPQRVLVPETVFDQRVAMAIERGKLADMLFDDPEKLSHRALGRIIGVLEKTSPFNAAMASDRVESDECSKTSFLGSKPVKEHSGTTCPRPTRFD